MFANENNYSQRDLWITRIYYFMMLGGGGFAFPFMNLFFVRQGLNGQEIGLVVALNSAVALFSALIWTEYSSKRGHHL